MVKKSDIIRMNILETQQAYKKKLIKPTELLEKYLQRIKKYSYLNTFITVCAEKAMLKAKAAQNFLSKSVDIPLLFGQFIGLKDMINTKNIRTTLGSGVFKNHVPKKDAVVVQKLKKSEAVIIGKHNTHELAYGTTGDISYFGACRNPYNQNKISGGSSDGSAAAVAANLCSASLGTDTSGSIRIPASICGVVGLKPTYGKIDNTGIYPLSWSMDHVGPITKTVIDNSILFDILTNRPNSSKSITNFLLYSAHVELKDTKIGIPTTYFFEGLESEVKTSVMQTIEILEYLGAIVTEIDVAIEEMNDLMKISSAIDRSEAYLINKEIAHDKSNLLDEITRKRILQGSDYKAHEYIEAQRLKSKASMKFKKSFNFVDIIVTPTIPILPPNIGDEYTIINGKTFNIRELLMRNTFISNYIGIPSISLPCAISNNGLPIGVQLMAGWHQEKLLYKVAYQLEQSLNLRNKLFVY